MEDNYAQDPKARMIAEAAYMKALEEPLGGVSRANTLTRWAKNITPESTIRKQLAHPGLRIRQPKVKSNFVPGAAAQHIALQAVMAAPYADKLANADSYKEAVDALMGIGLPVPHISAAMEAGKPTQDMIEKAAQLRQNPQQEIQWGL